MVSTMSSGGKGLNIMVQAPIYRFLRQTFDLNYKSLTWLKFRLPAGNNEE